MSKPVKKAAAKPAKPSISKKPKSSKKAAPTQNGEATMAPAKSKRIRGSFSMPAQDYALIGELKAASKKHGRAVKKNELLRAGLQALKALSADALQAALAVVHPTKSAAKKKPD